MTIYPTASSTGSIATVALATTPTLLVSRGGLLPMTSLLNCPRAVNGAAAKQLSNVLANEDVTRAHLSLAAQTLRMQTDMAINAVRTHQKIDRLYCLYLFARKPLRHAASRRPVPRLPPTYPPRSTTQLALAPNWLGSLSLRHRPNSGQLLRLRRALERPSSHLA